MPATPGTPGTIGNPTITLPDHNDALMTDGRLVLVSRASAGQDVNGGVLTVQVFPTGAAATIVTPANGGMAVASLTIYNRYETKAFRLDKPADFVTAGVRWWLVSHQPLDATTP